MPNRKSNSAPWIGVVVLAILLGGYVGAYYATVSPLLVFGPPGVPKRSETIYPAYHVHKALRLAALRVFTPIHWLDRRLRPHVWEPKP